MRSLHTTNESSSIQDCDLVPIDMCQSIFSYFDAYTRTGLKVQMKRENVGNGCSSLLSCNSISMANFSNAWAFVRVVMRAVSTASQCLGVRRLEHDMHYSLNFSKGLCRGLERGAL